MPLVIRMATGGGRQLAAQHSHSLEGWYAHIPGLKVLAPGTVEDARFMLAAALADPNPVLIFEHIVLYNAEGDLDPAVTGVDIEHAQRAPAGARRELVTYGNSLPKCLAAAERLAKDGHRRRGDRPARAAPARHADDHRVGRRAPAASSSSTRAGRAARSRPRSPRGWSEDAFYELDAPIRRVCSREVPVPYAAHMEEAALPQVDGIVDAVRAIVPKRA